VCAYPQCALPPADLGGFLCATSLKGKGNKTLKIKGEVSYPM